MALLAAWLLFPVAVLILCTGTGLLVEKAAGRELPGALLLPTGLAAIVIVATLGTNSSSTARLTLPAIVVLALAGYWFGFRRVLALRPDGVVLVALAGVFAVFAAPAVFTGHPTFEGINFLPDTSHQLTLADFLAHHGRDLSVLQDSSRFASLDGYFGTAYPIGSQAALGVLAPLGVIDLAWLYQPFLVILALATACGIYALLTPALLRPRLAAGVAFVAAQANLVYAFALQGSIKELAALTFVVLAVALVARALAARAGVRALVPIPVAFAAAYVSLGPAVVPFIGITAAALAIPLALDVVRRRDWGEAAALAGMGALTAVLALPSVIRSHATFEASSNVLSKGQDLGHLPYPVDPWHLLGIWLNGDYRYVIQERVGLNFVLIGVAAVGVVFGVLWALRRGATGLLLLLASVGLGGAYLLYRGNGYADTKVLMTISPALLALALVGGIALAREAPTLRVGGWLLVITVAAGVLVSGALAYHDSQPAPYDRYEELLDINQRFASSQPTLFTEYDEFGKYFLRDTRPQNRPETGTFIREERKSGRYIPYVKSPLEPDDYTLEYIEKMNRIVMRRSPSASRPPANFHRIWVGRYYEVWQRDPKVSVHEHLPLGPDLFQPGAVPTCHDVRALAGRARQQGLRVAYVERPKIPLFVPTGAPPVKNWIPYPAFPGALITIGPGRLESSLNLPRTADYQLWIEGSIGRRIWVLIDGKPAGSVSYELGYTGAMFRLARLRLTAGSHTVSIVRGGGDLRPGNGGSLSALRHVGPLWFSDAENEAQRLRTIAPADASQLCGRRLDWLETVG